jgi:spermidine/putrescine transport system substrate-binding protein
MARPGRMSRRQFLWRASATAIAVPTLAQVLAACGSDSSTTTSGSSSPITLSQSSPVPLPTYDDNPPIDSGLSPEAGPLRLMTWADYVPSSLLKDFEKASGVSVENVTINSADEALRKISSGAVPFDAYAGLVEVLPPLVQGKLVSPINHDYIPNLTNIWKALQDPWYDPGAVYTIGSVVGAFGIGWRTDMIDTDVANLPNPWDALWDPAAKGIVAFYNQFREAIAFSLFHNGVKDPNNPSDEELSAAVDGLKSLVKDNGARIGDDVGYVGLGEGTYGITQSFQGDSQYAEYSMPKGGDPSVFQYIWPPAATQGAVGGTVSTDFWMVSSKAKNPVLAHNFINWVLGKEQAQTWYKIQGLQLPQNDLTPEKIISLGLVPERLKTQIMTPSDFELGQWILPLPEAAQQRLVDAWSEVQRG